MSSKELHALLDEEAAAAEAARNQDDDAPLPPHVKVSRPNQARSKVLQVRLTDDEMATVEAIAKARGLPPSTLARDWLLQKIREDQAQPGTAAALIDQVLSAATQLRDLQCASAISPLGVHASTISPT
ncbi:hypothetical protein [Mycolicibacterium wolinskyi]|uniref:hypothetical protein n=1 Tax=Mycolicibacterium wolinskyi TaxID=59750 RepID=UPI0039179DE9